MKRKFFAVFFLGCFFLFSVLLRAEPETEYFQEETNLPVSPVEPSRIAGLLFWLDSTRAVTTDPSGRVLSWSDCSGQPVEFRALTKTEKPARLIPAVLGNFPAVSFTASQHQPPGLVSQPVTIAPDQGLTLLVLARVTEPVGLGFLLGYGAHYKTEGSLVMGLSGESHYRRTVLITGLGLNKQPLASSAGNIFGKGFVLMAVRYDPASQLVTLLENGVVVGQAKRTEPLASSYPFALGVESRGVWSFGGEVITALAYNRPLADGELAGVKAYFSSRYGLSRKKISLLASQLPFAYYPSRNEMEVAVQLTPELKQKAGLKPGETLKEVLVHVMALSSSRVVATGKVSLDTAGCGQEVFSVPELPDGQYAVEYQIGQYRYRCPKTFQRIHFPFEKTRYGLSHKVFPPFLPVEVVGNNRVKVVGREYRLNGFGCFDSVRSLDRELLAGPIQLVAVVEGKPVVWKNSSVSGRAEYEDEAVFTGTVSSSTLNVKARTVVNEDGCARVELTLLPGEEKKPVEALWLEIPLLDKEVPLFHFVADNGMRFNYAGQTPRGGKIQWYWEKWDGWVPIRWKVSQPGPEEGLIWTSADTRTHGGPASWDHRFFVPYLWLGAEERGLAFFMENEQNFETDYRSSLQKLYREKGKVVVRVEIFQRPVRLVSPRQITFGLMASPGKPMEKEFRTRPFASGVGPVVCWGGWLCSSKYPDNQDWSIVDRIQEIRRRGQYTPEDEAFFQAKYEEVKKRWPDRRVHDSTDWLWLTRHFAQRAAEQGRIHSGIYFEEHATDPKLPEWEVFQDEWASTEFNRFQEKPANWGVFSPSYHDFALYMANEWMKRGVSLYFDNTNPKRCYNPRFGPAYRSPDGTLRYGISLFGQRQYYRRIYKLLQETNAAGVEYPIDFTVHMTNTQTLPFNVWATATLDLEQRAYTEDPELVPPEVELGVRRFPSLGPHRILTEKMKQRQEAAVRKAAQKQGYQLPWPPDYTRTVTFGRQPGVIPLALDFVSGHGRHQANEYSPAILLRDWAMRRLHDIRPGAMYMATARLAAAYEKILLDSGYGQLEQVEEYNYWDPASPVRVTDERVKWMALKRKDRRQPEGLLLLQSYCRPEPVNTEVVWPGMNVLLDIETRELLSGKNGRFRVTMPENLSTRMFLAATQPAALQPLAAPENCLVEDFALAVPVHYDLTVVSLEGSRTKSLPAEFFPREDRPGKRFWRMPSSQRTAGLTFRDDWNLLEGNYLFSFRVRLPGEALVKLPEKATKSLLVLQWRVIPENKEKGIEPQMLQASLGCQRDGENFLWVVTEASAVKGKQQTPLLAEGQDKGKFIVLGQARPGQWVEIGLADRETECTFLFQGRPVSNVTVPEVWSGRLCLNQGKLLASGTVAYLDLTDLTVSWQP